MGEPGSARSTPPGGTPVGEDGLQLRRMGQSAGVLGTSDVFVFRRVTGSRFVHVGGTGRARGWAGGVEMDVDTDPLGSQLRVGRPVWVRHTYPRRIFGPYYAAVAVAVRLSRDVLVVFGAPTTEGDVSLELTAAEVVAAAGVAAEFVDTVTPAKYLVDELQMLHASRALATRRGPGGSVAEVLGDVAQVAAEALSCELAIAWLPDGRCHVHESGWTLPEQGRPLVEAIMRELWDARDRFPPVVQDAADTPLAFPLDPDSGVRSYYTLPIGAPPSALLLVAHTDADPRGFTQHCLTLGEQLAVTADTGVATAVLREQLLYAVAEESSARQEVVNANIELGKVNAELSEAALHDPLTGLANRVLLQRHAQRLGRWHTPAPPAGAGEATPTPVLLYIDLDNFKSVNDDYGHAVGDGVLVEFARRLRESCRPHDVAARLAGDEFVLLMTEPLTDVQALAVANRLVRAASIPFLIADTTITIGASVGIVTVAGNDDGAQPPLEGWLHRADLAMYRAKTRGRGRAEIFTNRTTAPKITHTRRWADDPATGRRLRAALDEGVLRLRYQPTVDLVTGEVLGVQAVIHWPQPPGPAVRPAELVPLAERTGLIGPLGEWALREACRQAAVWNT